jgi:hypothetical protein
MQGSGKGGAFRALPSSRFLLACALALISHAGRPWGPPPALAVSIDYGDFVHRAGWTPLPGAVWDLDRYGDFTLAADAVGLHLLDLSLPQEPQLVGEYPLARRALAGGRR